VGVATVIDRIRTRGHWDIAIRPEPFRSDRVAYDRLEETLNQAVVRLRGWPVPFIGHEPLLHGRDWIGQDIDARGLPHMEAWRFFTSGQFAQLRVVSADLRAGAEGNAGDASPVIEVWEILFYLTEIVELAARLALSDAGGEQMTIETRLHGLENRLLVGTPARELHGNYRATMSSIEGKRTEQREHLLAESRQIAVEMAREMFLRFGFNASEEVLTDYQTELTGGK
jgi:hypothetical protein